MPKRAAKDEEKEPTHQLTVRIPASLEKQLRAYSAVLNRSYRELAESALREYLADLPLDADQKRKIKALLA